mgnify:CR=1 FL=1
MKVGDLVRVRMAHRTPKNGIVVKVAHDDYNRVYDIHTNDVSLTIWTNPIDMRLLNESGRVGYVVIVSALF